MNRNRTIHADAAPDTTPTPLDEPTPPPTLRGGRSWPLALGAALVPVLFTAAGSAAGQLLGLAEAPAILVLAAAAAASALLGLVVLARSRAGARRLGLRAPIRLGAALWLLPPLATVLIVAATAGIRVPAALIAPYIVLVAAVALNEEVWFRGIVIAALRGRGARTAIIGSSILFGVLHLANLAGGQSLGASLAQLGFAIVFGIAAAQLVILTGSLWPAIGWHAAWNLVNFLGGNGDSAIALIGVGAATAVIVGYAIVLGAALGRAGLLGRGDRPAARGL